MEILVINLKRSTDRRKSIEQQLDRLQLPFKFIEGVDAQNFTTEQSAKFEEGKSAGTHALRPGLFGSSWAHIKVYEHVISNNIPKALVLEDDLLIDKEILRILKEKWLEENWWDFVHLGYTPANWDLFISWCKISWQRIKHKPLFMFYALAKLPYIVILYSFEYIRQQIRSRIAPAPVRFMRPLYMGRGYFITQEGAKKIMQIAYPIRYAGDELFNQARVQSGLRFYGYCPPPLLDDQEGFDSETL